MILLCPRCKTHPYQDKTYGRKMRVHNPTSKANEYRCTVCSALNQGKVRKTTDAK